MLRRFDQESPRLGFLNWEIKHDFALQGTLSVSKVFFFFLVVIANYGSVLATSDMHRPGILINTLQYIW